AFDDATGFPPMPVRPAPARRSAVVAGVLERTLTARAVAVELLSSTPRYACWAFPLEISWETIDLIVSDGIAKPTPSLPPEPLSICALTPITCASAFSSGPPELPWLIAA